MPSDLASFSEAVDAIVGMLTVASILAAAGVFFYVQSQQLRERRESRFRDLAVMYSDYLKLALERPHLQATEHSPGFASLADIENADDRLRLEILFEILTAMLEASFVLYDGVLDDIKKRQASGWRNYRKAFCARGDYREWWGKHYLGGDLANPRWDLGKSQYDVRFEAEMHQFLKSELETASRNSEMESV